MTTNKNKHLLKSVLALSLLLSSFSSMAICVSPGPCTPDPVLTKATQTYAFDNVCTYEGGMTVTDTTIPRGNASSVILDPPAVFCEDLQKTLVNTGPVFGPGGSNPYPELLSAKRVWYFDVECDWSDGITRKAKVLPNGTQIIRFDATTRCEKLRDLNVFP